LPQFQNRLPTSITNKANTISLLKSQVLQVNISKVVEVSIGLQTNKYKQPLEVTTFKFKQIGSFLQVGNFNTTSKN
jgi:hypothetical protein